MGRFNQIYDFFWYFGDRLMRSVQIRLAPRTSVAIVSEAHSHSYHFLHYYGRAFTGACIQLSTLCSTSKAESPSALVDLIFDVLY